MASAVHDALDRLSDAISEGLSRKEDAHDL
jgi:hypothetical protein